MRAFVCVRALVCVLDCIHVRACVRARWLHNDTAITAAADERRCQSQVPVSLWH